MPRRKYRSGPGGAKAPLDNNKALELTMDNLLSNGLAAMERLVNKADVAEVVDYGHPTKRLVRHNGNLYEVELPLDIERPHVVDRNRLY